MIPLTYLGEGQFATPPGFAKRCDKELVIGEVLRWEQVQDRSAASHKHYFAVVRDAWSNLPEALASEFTNPTHLRKHALIKAGYCTMTRIVCADESEAIRAVLLFRGMDTYAICEVDGNVMTTWRAKSQSMKSMGKAEFQKSKDDVLTVISQIIGADATQAGQAA